MLITSSISFPCTSMGIWSNADTTGSFGFLRNSAICSFLSSRLCWETLDHLLRLRSQCIIRESQSDVYYRPVSEFAFRLEYHPADPFENASLLGSVRQSGYPLEAFACARPSP